MRARQLNGALTRRRLDADAECGLRQNIAQAARALPEVDAERAVVPQCALVQPDSIAQEALKLDIRADRPPRRRQLCRDLVHLDGALREHRARLFFALGHRLPAQVEIELLGGDLPAEAGQGQLVFLQQQPLEYRFDDIFTTAGHGHRYAQRSAN